MRQAARILAACLLTAAVPAAAQIAVQPLAPGEVLLEVASEGRARVRPDRVALTGGVVTTGATAREALDANAAAMTRVVAALRNVGTQARDIQTQQISVQPRFERSQDYQEQPRIIGYVAQNSVSVATGRIALAPRLIEAMFGAGANNVYGPTFAADDRAVLQAARADAARAARAQADAYAAAFGMRVARTVRISERGRNIQPADVLVSGARINSVAISDVSGGPPPPPPPAEVPVQGGQLDQRVTVFVDYALVPR